VVNTAGRNALVTSLMVCCGFTVCTTPNMVHLITSYINQTVDYTDWFYQSTVVLVDANSCINAFILRNHHLYLTCISPVYINAHPLYQRIHLEESSPVSHLSVTCISPVSHLCTLMPILCINAFILRNHHLSLTCLSPVSHLSLTCVH